MPKKEYVLTQEVVNYVMSRYKNVLRDILWKSIDHGIMPEIKLVYKDGEFFIDITYKELK
jgi:hypothetical protein